MTSQTPGGEGLDLRRLSSRCAAVLLTSGAAVLLLSSTAVSGRDRVVCTGVAVAAVLSALACLLLPFHRWHRAWQLPLIPLALAMVGVGNVASFNPYNSGCFFFVLAVYIGLSQPRGTTTAFAPLIGVCFWFPLQHAAPASHGSWVLIGACDTAVVAALLGEHTAYLVSRLTSAARRLHEHDERRFARLIENSSDITFLINAAGVVEYVSPSLLAVLGREAGRITGLDVDDLIRDHLHAEDAAAAVEAITRTLAGGTAASATLDLRFVHGDGSWRLLDCTVSSAEDGHGIVVNARDVTERHQLELAIREHALRHPKTGLANRTLLLESLSAATSAGHQVSVVYCDVDGFKAVNDRLGRDGGDAVLEAVAQRLDALVGEPSLVAHLEGDEFAVLLVGVGPQQTEEFAGDLLTRLADPIDIAGSGPTRISVSLGLAGSWSEGFDCVTDADLAMYDAKAAGGGGFRVYSPQLREERMAEVVLRESVRQALHNGELRLHFQPIVDIATASLRGLEALIRWQHPKRGLIGPWAFLPMAETLGLMGEVDRWVLRTACRTVAELKVAHPELRACYVSANVSPARLEEPGFAGEVMTVLAETGLAPEHLVLEITESAALGLERVVSAVRALRTLGVRFAIDDFGTGYSSLSYLQTVDFDILKVDKSFTDNITEQDESTRLVSVIAELARTMGMHTVVEGVETAVQALALLRLGLPSAQGYLYSRPVAPGELARVVREMDALTLTDAA